MDFWWFIRWGDMFFFLKWFIKTNKITSSFLSEKNSNINRFFSKTNENRFSKFKTTIEKQETIQLDEKIKEDLVRV